MAPKLFQQIVLLVSFRMFKELSHSLMDENELPPDKASIRDGK